MTDEKTPLADDGEPIDAEEVPETAGPIEQVTPGSGALGRPDLGANPFG